MAQAHETGSSKSEAQTNAVQSAFTKGLSDIRFRITGLTRQLLAQGKHMTMTAQEYAETTKSIEALAQALTTAGSLIENLQAVAQSEVWISRDVEKIAQDLATIIHAASNLDAFQQLPNEMSQKTTFKTTQALTACANVLRKSVDVLGLVRDISGIELGIGNLGLSADEFKHLAKDNTLEGRFEGPRPEDLPGFQQDRQGLPPPMTAEELAEVEKLRVTIRLPES